jgi:radical SAM protein with 4Fe4S-binding SPASM domain
MKIKRKYTKRLRWIDDYVRNVRLYIFVRTEDNILIKRPNQATQINSTGAGILKFLLDGGKVGQLLKKIGIDKAREVELFMLAVKSYIDGELDEFSLNPAVESSTFKMNFSKLPVLSEFALTYSCNLKCKFCYAGCNCTTNPNSCDTVATLKECFQVIDVIFKQAKVPSISFTGGEPTLRRKELTESIRYAKKIGMRVNLITNGTLIDKRYCQELVDCGLDSVQISIEGVSAKTHDIIVGHQGAFEKSIYAIELFKNSGIHVHTNTTLNRLNMEESFQLPGFVYGHGLERFSMNLIIPAGSSIFNKELVIPYSEVGPIIRKIHTESRKIGVEFMWYSPVPMCMFNSITEGLGNKGCAACDGLLSIAPNGNVLPCSSYDQPVGNILSEPFKSVWGGAGPVFFREKKFAHEICQRCDMLPLCNGGCPLYWRNMGYQEIFSVKKETVL